MKENVFRLNDISFPLGYTGSMYLTTYSTRFSCFTKKTFIFIFKGIEMSADNQLLQKDFFVAMVYPKILKIHNLSYLKATDKHS